MGWMRLDELAGPERARWERRIAAGRVKSYVNARGERFVLVDAAARDPAGSPLEQLRGLRRVVLLAELRRDAVRRRAA